MKTPQEYILEQLDKLKPTESALIPDPKNIEDLIFKTLLSKKFRKYSSSPELKQHIISATHLNVSTNQPIKIALPFGGYKLWRLEETPEVDWAELFTMMYFSNWLMPIAKSYKPGVWFDFCSDDVFIERMNNIPQKDTDAYVATFRSLINFLSQYLPANMKFTFSRVGDRYTPEEFNKEFEEKLEKLKQETGGKLPTLTEEQRRMIDLNVKLRPGQDTDPLWREKIQQIHEAYARMDRRRPY